MLLAWGCAATDSSSESRTEPDYLLGALGETGLNERLQSPWDHSVMLAHDDLLGILAEALTVGRITGYDLRPAQVYANFPHARTLIYSHNSPEHLRQLITLLGEHNLDAKVYLTPKVSAFLYREGWGGDGSNLQTLPGGVRVVRGREAAVLFEFDRPEDRSIFHSLVRRYAKRDSEDQTGLIADAWWQPFYYSDAALEDFVKIGLVVLYDDVAEATLTVTMDKLDSLSTWAQAQGFDSRVEIVWVNPSFHRFLQGDYK